VPRDRRWDFLYDRQRQPVKAYVLERFAEELAAELATWPPPFLDWVSDELRARYAEGAAEKPRDDVLRLALALARLDLLREWDAQERLLQEEAHRLQSPAERSAAHLLTVFLTERCLGLKEYAQNIPMGRPDLAGALDDVERRLFKVTLA
jgi:hypothetical protein